MSFAPSQWFQSPRLLFSAALLGGLACATDAVAQKDVIYWMDGTVTRDVRIKEFSLVTIKYTERGSKDRAGDQVVRIDLAEFKEEFGGVLEAKDPDGMVTMAREFIKRKPLLAQVAFLESARLYLEQNNAGTAFETLKELIAADEKGGLVAETFRLKFDYYIGNGQFGDARKVAKKFTDEALNNGWPEGFGHEGTFMEILATDVSGNGKPKELQTRYGDLLRTVQGAYPKIAHQAEVRLAASLQASGDKDGARRLYDGLLKRDNLDGNTLAGVYLGLGKMAFEEGTGANKEAYREALLWFTRVYVLCREDAWDGYVAEALHFGSEAAAKWGGPNSGYMKGKLRYLLRQQYPNSPWAKR